MTATLRCSSESRISPSTTPIATAEGRNSPPKDAPWVQPLPFSRTRVGPKSTREQLPRSAVDPSVRMDHDG